MSRREFLTKGMMDINREARPHLTGDVPWLVAQGRAGQEMLLQRQMYRCGVTAFLPARWRFRGVNRYVKRKQRMAFAGVPGMVWLEATSFLRSLRHMPIDIMPRLMRRDENNVTIPGGVLASFIDCNRHYFDVDGAKAFMKTLCEFDVGDLVIFSDGPFVDMEARVVSIKGPRSTVTFEVFGAPREIELLSEQLEKAA